MPSRSKLFLFSDVLMTSSMCVLSVCAISLPDRPWWLRLMGWSGFFALVLRALAAVRSWGISRKADRRPPGNFNYPQRFRNEG